MSNLTNQQTAFVDAVMACNRNVALIARAGCGKTHTIMEAVKQLHKAKPGLDIAICAYNKSIADEIKEKCKVAGYDWKKVQACTVHSLGMSLVNFVFRPTVEPKKVLNLLNPDSYTGNNRDMVEQYGSTIARLVSYAKQEGFGFFDDSAIGDLAAWFRIAEHYDVNGVDDQTHMESIINIAMNVYRRSLEITNIIDYDDMILFPLIKNLRVKYQKDVIFMDEAQDLSRVRQAIARKFLKPSGKLHIIGDDRQAIYGFAGASPDSLPNMVKQLDSIVLPLTVTWRCGKNIVAHAQTIVADIEAAPNAVNGEVITVSEMPDDIKVGDAILCRNTAPLITLAYGFIRKGIAAKVEGRNIGEGLLALVNRWKVKTIDAFQNKLDVYRDREIQKAQAKGNDSKVEAINDKCDTIVEICNSVAAKGNTDIASVKQAIENLFGDSDKGEMKNCIILATYHRSKGREWDRVILWEHNARCPSKAAKQEWQKIQEANLAYVAYTRAKNSLIFVG